MARKATGQVIERESANGTTYALRFRAYGERRFLTLGSTAEGWDRPRAEVELQNVLADVRRGIWQPPRQEPEVSRRLEVPTFHEFASEWYEGKALDLAENTRLDYLNTLSSHLLPHFARYKLAEITVEEVDRYRRSKERERAALVAALEEQAKLPADKREKLPRPLSNATINRTIKLLSRVLEQALEYGHIDRNPAKGKARLLKQSKPSRSYLQPPQVAALLAAAGELDHDARYGDTGRRRPLLAVLTLAGLRIGEALDLRWRDVNLAARRLRVVSAKTDAGVRAVDLSPTLQELLSEFKTRTRQAGPDDLVFGTSAGKRDNPSNVRNRFLKDAREIANAKLEEDGHDPIAHVSPHTLRRTFASLLLASGADVPYAMAQLGHENAQMTLNVYAKVIASKTDHGAAVDGLVGASDWAPMGTNADPIEVDA